MKTYCKTGSVKNDEGTTVFYSFPGTLWTVESRKRHIQHANGVGTWDYTSYHILRAGKQVNVKQSLKDAVAFAESMIRTEGVGK